MGAREEVIPTMIIITAGFRDNIHLIRVSTHLRVQASTNRLCWTKIWAISRETAADQGAIYKAAGWTCSIHQTPDRYHQGPSMMNLPISITVVVPWAGSTGLAGAEIWQCPLEAGVQDTAVIRTGCQTTLIILIKTFREVGMSRRKILSSLMPSSFRNGWWRSTTSS